MKTGGLGRNRTIDTRILNPLLYRLSYWAKYPKYITGYTRHNAHLYAHPLVMTQPQLICSHLSKRFGETSWSMTCLSNFKQVNVN